MTDGKLPLVNVRLIYFMCGGEGVSGMEEWQRMCGVGTNDRKKERSLFSKSEELRDERRGLR